jgi:O-antigen/teichoic acid export membrane protein
MYLAALMTAQLCALVRYVVLARWLGPEELGMAVIVVITGQFFDLITDTASDRFLIQDRDGARPQALRLVQLVAIGKGVVVAALLVVLALPVARFAGASQVAGALMAFSCVPLIAAFTNFEYRQRQRDESFGPEARVLVWSEVVGVLATCAAAILLRDHFAVLYGLAGRALAAVIASHAVAATRYRLGFNPTIARRLFRFGAPLTINGFLLFIATQSDRVIVSRWLGLDTLGKYSVLFLLVFYPTAMIMRYISTLYLPKLTSLRAASDPSNSSADQLGGTCFLVATIIFSGFAFVGPLLTPWVFGSAFVYDPFLVTLVGLLMAWRLLEVPPTTRALARGRSDIVTIKNFVRLLAIPAALVGLNVIGGLAGVVIGLIAGEIIANCVATLAICRATNHPARPELERYFLLATCGSILAACAAASDEAPSGHWLLLLCAVAVVSIAAWHERWLLGALRGLHARQVSF